MDNMRVWSAAGVIALVLVVGFVLSVPRSGDSGAKQAATIATPMPTVYLHDAYKKGTHTITAKVAAPNACTIISGAASVADASTIIVTLDMPADSGVCLQVPATTTLSFTVAADAGVNLTASINGSTATTTLY